MSRVSKRVLAILALLLVPVHAFARDDDYQRMLDRFNQLATDRTLGARAPIAMDRARMALAQLKDAKRGAREYWMYVTDRRIETARSTAEAEVLEEQQVALQRDNDRLQLAIARREADAARAELERQRLQSQIRAEEAESARRDADAARLEGEQATQAAEAARAERDQAKKMAAAQARASALARKEAELEASLEAGGATPKAKPKPKPNGKK